MKIWLRFYGGQNELLLLLQSSSSLPWNIRGIWSDIVLWYYCCSLFLRGQQNKVEYQQMYLKTVVWTSIVVLSIRTYHVTRNSVSDISYENTQDFCSLQISHLLSVLPTYAVNSGPSASPWFWRIRCETAKKTQPHKCFETPCLTRIRWSDVWICYFFISYVSVPQPSNFDH